ncbi:MAG: sulfite oxidase-like oxidoreductase [Dehalococcoidia bacterium]|nr:sulfite oxidase-like oxidoreductase [Dehalococcoidia bacterium]MSQ16144.1 sulfite oxidase-like oxidoreductase [Dehalococcoidia bacterium]
MRGKSPDKVKKIPDQGRGERVPAGQYVTQKFPVLSYGPTPQIDLKTWSLRVFGLVDRPLELTWAQFLGQGLTTLNSDFHCVTQWSALDQTWEGIPFSAVVGPAMPKAEATFVMAHSYGGYTTNIPLDVCMEEGFFAHKQNGQEMGKDHGWPLRLLIPSRYAWKSAKWVNGIELMPQDAPGFWEQRGYNNNADPWKEERFWPELNR